MNLVEFFDFCKEKKIVFSSLQKEQICLYLEEIELKNQVMDLTANVTREEILEKNFLDGILSSQLIDPLKKNCIDIGSGAGFPGILYAILLPSMQFTLLEPMKKRAEFLKECQKKLQLKNVEILSLRAEEYAKEKREFYDYASARGVARLSILFEMILPLLKVHGHFLALKGPRLFEEEKEAKKAFSIFGIQRVTLQKYLLPTNKEQRWNALYQKTKISDKKYPRAYPQIKKKPL